MCFNDVPEKVQQKILNTRRVFAFYSYINVKEQYLQNKVVISAQFAPRYRPKGVTIHFFRPNRHLTAGNLIRYTDSTTLELHSFSPSLYKKPL